MLLDLVFNLLLFYFLSGIVGYSFFLFNLTVMLTMEIWQ